MPQTVKELMSRRVVTCPSDAPIRDVARRMRDEDVGDVIVVDRDHAVGIVTDRDIAVRAVAEGVDPSQTRAREVLTGELVTITPDTAVDDAVRLMREHAVRRLPVLEGGRPVGVVSLGDLALERDPRSALADISAAPPPRQ